MQGKFVTIFNFVTIRIKKCGRDISHTVFTFSWVAGSWDQIPCKEAQPQQPSK